MARLIPNISIILKEDDENSYLEFTDEDGLFMTAYIFEDGSNIKFISANGKTNITIACFIFGILEDLGFCSWDQFECLSYPGIDCREMHEDEKYISMYLYNREVIENKSQTVLADVYLHDPIDVNLTQLFVSASSVAMQLYDFIPNLYVYRYVNNETGHEYTNQTHQRGLVKDCYNAYVYSEIGLKRGEIDDDAYVKEFARAIFAAHSTASSSYSE